VPQAKGYFAMNGDVRITLNGKAQKARTLLIKVATDVIDDTFFPGLIGYKDFWERISDERWTRAKNKTIISLVTTISGYELQQGRPMLNELVVNVSGYNRCIPGEELQSIRRHLRRTFNVQPLPYKSHGDAQRACWEYWGRQATQRVTSVEEGEPEDCTMQFRKRNAKIIQACKERDNYKCKACAFRLKIGKIYIIDCHHKYSLGNNRKAIITKIDDLICLCPTCHRIAHTRKAWPLDIDEIRSARK
jgi:hypothetical protein